MRPRKDLERQINSCRVERVDGIFQVDAKSIVRVKSPRFDNQSIGKIPINPPVTFLIRVGKIATRHVAADAEVTLLAKQLTGQNSHRKVAYGTEGGLFQKAGIPTVVCGPGNIDQAHKADAFIRITELEKCGNFIDRLITAITL